MDRTYRSAAVVLVVCGLVIIAALWWQERRALDAALVNYRKESAVQAHNVAQDVEQRFQSMYSALRTMARLPGVRALDRSGASLAGDARVAVQEIYNDLASSVAMSEVYLVLRDFDPDVTDPGTGRLQEPVATFDHLIVGRNAASEQAGAGAAVAETEIHEYRLMRAQLARFATRYGAESTFVGLAYPAVTGPEVITCDNTRYDPRRPDDAARSGLVYSVPFYDAGGQLRGIVAGVLLTGVLRDLLPAGGYALHHAAHRYVAGSAADDSWRSRLAAIHEDRPANDLLYSDVLKLDIPDLDGPFTLWVGRPDATFDSREDVRAAHRVAHVGYAVTVFVTALLLLLLRAIHERRRTIERHTAELEQRVDERTAALREALATAEAAGRAKSQFLANMSHEMRTPINGMLGMNEILLRSALDPQQRRCAETIRSSGATLSAIIDDVLDLSRIEAGALTLHEEAFDLRELVEDLAGSLAETAYAKGLTLHCDVAPSLAARRRGDLLRLRQVLTHLLGNAIRFTNRGFIVIAVRAGDDPASLRFSVRDTGIGIAPEDQRRIFDAFVQVDEGHARRYGGAGLGLSLSTGLVRLMGGALTVDSVPGQGSDFRFTLRMPATEASQPLPPRGAMRVLVVDENPMDRSILAAYLGHCGCTVSAVESVAEAVALTQAGGGGRGSFDTLVVGYYGAATLGLERLAALKPGDQRRRLHRLLLAPLSAHPTPAETAAAGVAGVLCKPLRRAELRECMDRLQGIAAPAPVAAASGAECYAGRVLVAEDNPVNQEVARALLEMAGLAVDLAADGAAAVDAWQRGGYDLVFMDCQMPGTSGYDATGEIRARERRDGRARTPIIALTAHALEGDRERCIESGMDDYLSKPFTDQQLRAVLLRWLGRAEARTAAAG